MCFLTGKGSGKAGTAGCSADQGTGILSPVTAADAQAWTASKVSGSSWMHVMPRMCSNVACTSTVNHLEESIYAGLGPIPTYRPGWSSRCFPPRWLPQPGLCLSLPRLQREPPTTCHKIIAGRAVQLSSKLDFEKGSSECREEVAKQMDSALAMGDRSAVIWQVCYRKGSIHQRTPAPSTISLAVPCPTNWKLGPFSPSVPFQGQIHAYGAASCLLDSPGRAILPGS